MRIAVVGTGISGLVAARLLHPDHELTVLEAASRVGGHTHTHTVVRDGRPLAIDTGFIVYNERTYPAFTRLLEILGVATQPSEMSFSVRDERSGLEWNGTNLDTLFAQRRNLVRPSFWRMLADVARFNREAPSLLDAPDEELSLGDWLSERRYSRAFVEHYIVPMGAAIWSARPDRMLSFPALAFVRFFRNHGMLSLRDRPQWRVVSGGSARYVERLIEPFREAIRTDSAVASIRRHDDHVELTTQAGEHARYDRVILAVHADQALAMLADPSDAEREILRAIPYQENEAVLHTDTSQLPRRRKAWAAWNYVIPADSQERLSVTYDMNILQGLETPETYCVTLNPSAPIDPAAVIARMTYHHPVFDAAGVAAQARHAEIDGTRRTHFCGAWWGYGFHEDGVQSALAVARSFGIEGIEAAARSRPGAWPAAVEMTGASAADVR
ncbi:MAG: NAD(P)/FAD-dependent oxidoreductase [Planctomycetota bacterium]